MKKPAATLLYPGVVLRSNGMIIIPQIPKAKTSTVRLLMNAKAVRAPIAIPSKRK